MAEVVGGELEFPAFRRAVQVRQRHDAGVGVGTIYRHFPTRESLIEAAYRSELDVVCDAAAGFARTLGAGQALRAWMDRFVDYMTTKLGMSNAIRVVISAGGDPTPTAASASTTRSAGSSRRRPRRARPGRASTPTTC